MLREQAKRRRGLCLEKCEGRAGIDAFAMFERHAQFIIADENATDAKAFVDPHQIRRGIGMDSQARRFQDRAQICERRTLAIGAGDVDHRRQLAFGMIEPIQQKLYAVEAEIDPLGMQRGQPRDQPIER